MNIEENRSLFYSLREYFLSCPLLKEGSFGLERLDALFPSGALLEGEETERARYLDGDRICQFDFLLALCEGQAADTAGALEAFARLDALAAWMEQQSRRRFLPFLTGGRQPLSLAALGQAGARQEAEDRMVWRLRCRLVYCRPAA
ncbi:MAG: hypothetical protein HFG26_06230 [Provencibacterium sp.]|nr:hypothetical protein [Provencibacterium sp.]